MSSQRSFGSRLQHHAVVLIASFLIAGCDDGTSPIDSDTTYELRSVAGAPLPVVYAVTATDTIRVTRSSIRALDRERVVYSVTLSQRTGSQDYDFTLDRRPLQPSGVEFSAACRDTFVSGQAACLLVALVSDRGPTGDRWVGRNLGFPFGEVDLEFARRSAERS